MKARTRLVSAYTPSNTAPEVLKRIFVQREGMLQRLVNRLERALQGRKSYHALLVGPRGSGKTHLVTMLVHELGLRKELRDRVRIAWLGEDDTFTGLIDIALGMGDQLAKRYPDEFPANFREEVRGLKADDAAEVILTRTLERASEAHVLLVMENLNRAFNGLGDGGQKQWRAFLQNRGRITLLSTSQQLFEGIESRDRPFFGFFDINHLKPLSVNDARALIYKIAIEEGRVELAQFLATPEGRFRVRALHHLAGGNHRLYVQLSEFLTKDSLEDLVAAFEQIEEELTPYFQERLRSLAPQQARIVECLCGAPGAMSVKQIHEDTFIPEGSCSKQLSLLKQMNYVRGTSSGKETYYELREPLLRLCLEVKHRRGAPLELVVQFIRAWFPQEKLKTLQDRQDGHSPLTDYITLALVKDSALNNLLFESLSREVNQRISVGEIEAASKLREELGFITSNASDLSSSGASDARRLTIAEYTAIIEGLSAPADQVTWARVNRGVAFGQQGDVDREIADYTSVIEQVDARPDQIARARLNRGVRHGQRGDVDSEIADYTAIIQQLDAPVDQVAGARFNRGVRRGQRGDIDSAIADYTAVIEQVGTPPNLVAKARFNRGAKYGQRGDIDREITDYTAVIEQAGAPPDQVARARINRGARHGQRGETARAVADYTAVIEQADAPPDLVAWARFNRGARYSDQGDVANAIADYTAVIEQVSATSDQVVRARFNRGVAHGQQGDIASEIADYTAVIEQSDAPPDQIAKARVNRGATYSQQGDIASEIADYTAVIEQSDAPPDQIAKARVNRGATYSQQDNFASAIADYTAVIEQVDAPPDLVAAALINRGITRHQQGDGASELADYTVVIEQANVPPKHLAKARLIRGFRYDQQGDGASSMTDYTAVIEQINAPPDLVAGALINRGYLYDTQGDAANAISDYSTVIDQPDSPPGRVAGARFNRGLVYSRQGDLASAIIDYTALIEQAGAPPYLVAVARLNRGVAYGQLGDVANEIADYTAVIEQSDAPPDQIAKARVNRGATYSQQGNFASAIADLTAVIEQPDTTPDQVTGARFNRGVCGWRSGNYLDSEADYCAILDDPSSSEAAQNSARFAVIEPMIITRDAPVVASALEEAFQRVPGESPSFGGTPGDVLATLLRRGHQDWSTYLHALVPVYLANHYASELGTAAVRSAGVFDGGDYSLAQMDIWLAAWTTVADENEQLRTSTKWLAAALEAIKSKSERPLLSIPLEIRTLIRPLLSNSLGPVEAKS